MVDNKNIKHIVRVANVDIPGHKHLVISLKKIKGIGFNLAKIICNITGINPQTKAGLLADEEISKLDILLRNIKGAGIPIWAYNRRRDYDTGEDTHLVTSSLTFTKENDIKRLRKIKCYRGVRHSRRLPVRGQRTKSNFRRTKGKVVGVKKKGK
jgi:small subunit ribosomal protein S13